MKGATANSLIVNSKMTSNDVGRTAHSQEDWNIYRELIGELWIEKNLTLKKLAAVLAQEHGFYFTKRQFDRITEKWGLRKNVRKGEMMVIVQTQRARDRKGKKTAVRIHGQELSRSKIVRWEQRYKDETELLNINSVAAPALEDIEFSPRNPDEPERSRYNFRYGDNAGILESPKLTRLSFLLTEDGETDCDDVPPMDLDSSNDISDTDPAFRVRDANQPQGNASMVVANIARNGSYLEGRYGQTAHGGFLAFGILPFPTAAPPIPSKASRMSYGLPYKRAEEMKYKCQLLRLKQQSYRDDTPEYLETLMQLAGVFMMQRNLKNARKIFWHVLQTREGTLGFEHEDTLSAAVGLTEAIFEQGKYSEAEPRIYHLYEAAPRVLGPDHRVSIIARTMMSKIVGQIGMREEKTRLAREVLQISLQTYGPRHYITILAICNLAEELDADDGENLCRIALGICDHGGENMDEAAIATGRQVGFALARQGRKEENLGLRTDVLNRARKVYGPNNILSLPFEADVCDGLAFLEKFTDAAKMSRQTLLQLRKVEYFAIYEALYTMIVTARALEGLHRYSEAEKWLMRVISELEKLCGKFNYDTVNVVEALANCYQEQDRLGDAITLYTQNHREFVEAGIESRPALRTLFSLARTLYNAQRFEEAAVHFRKLIDMETRLVGETHKDIIIYYMWLGDCYADLQQWDEQIMVYRHKHEQLQRSAVENMYTLKIWRRLAISLRSAQQYEESEKCFANLIKRQEVVLGIAHETVIATYELLGDSYHKNNKYDEEIALYQAKLDQLRTLGVDKESFGIWSLLGAALVSASRFEEAAECLQTLIQRQEEVLGPSHRATIDSYESFGDCYLEAERYDDMVVLYQKKHEELLRADIVETNQYLHIHFLLAWSLYKVKNYPDSATHLLSLIDKQERVFGLTHHNTLRSYDYLIDCYVKEYRYDEILLFSEAKMDLFASIDADDDARCKLFSLIALALYRTGGHKYAALLLELIIDHLEALHGPEHLAVLEAKVRMGWCCEQRRRYGKALAAYEAAQKGLMSLRETGKETNESYVKLLAEDVPKMRERVVNGEGVGDEESDSEDEEEEGQEDDDDDDEDVDEKGEGAKEDDQIGSEIMWGDYMDLDGLEELIPGGNWIF